MNKNIEAIIAIILIIAIVIGLVIIIKPRQERYEYNHFLFIKDKQGFWHTKIGINNKDVWISMYFYPGEVDKIPVDPNTLAFINNPLVQEIYITMPPEAPSMRAVSAIELQKIVGNIRNRPARLAVIYNPTNKTVRVITCENSTLQTPVFFLVKTNTTGIDLKANCIIIHGPTEREILRAVNTFDYYMLGIIKWNTTIQSNQNQN